MSDRKCICANAQYLRLFAIPGIPLGGRSVGIARGDLDVETRCIMPLEIICDADRDSKLLSWNDNDFAVAYVDGASGGIFELHQYALLDRHDGGLRMFLSDQICSVGRFGRTFEM